MGTNAKSEDRAYVRSVEVAKNLGVEPMNDSGFFAMLRTLRGTKVAVTWSSVPLSSRHFKPQVTVFGTLEQQSEDSPAFRVLITDDTFAYLNPRAVQGIVSWTKGWRIYLRLPS